MVTVLGWLFCTMSFTINWATYAPGWSATKVGFTVVAPARAAALPAGRLVKDQLWVREYPLVPLEFSPCRVTVSSTKAFWAAPGFVTGGMLLAPMTTVEGWLPNSGSLTINCAT